MDSFRERYLSDVISKEMGLYDIEIERLMNECRILKYSTKDFAANYVPDQFIKSDSKNAVEYLNKNMNKLVKDYFKQMKIRLLEMKPSEKAIDKKEDENGKPIEGDFERQTPDLLFNLIYSREKIAIYE